VLDGGVAADPVAAFDAVPPAGAVVGLGAGIANGAYAVAEVCGAAAEGDAPWGGEDVWLRSVERAAVAVCSSG
jgi:hypothetical protein